MSINMILTETEFCNMMKDKSFTYEGLRTLFDYLEDNIEIANFNPNDTDMEWSEYTNKEAIWDDYELTIKQLGNATTVLPIENGDCGYIVFTQF